MSRKMSITRKISITSSEAARVLQAARVTHGAGPGRPRSKAPRCPCGAMTRKRARARAHHCGRAA
jgi:hypothetical protein